MKYTFSAKEMELVPPFLSFINSRVGTITHEDYGYVKEYTCEASQRTYIICIHLLKLFPNISYIYHYSDVTKIVFDDKSEQTININPFIGTGYCLVNRYGKSINIDSFTILLQLSIDDFHNIVSSNVMGNSFIKLGDLE